MNYLFSNLEQVKKVVLTHPFGLIFDVDGTIAEIAPTAEAVKVTPGCKKHLRSLVKRLPVVAAISGRLTKILRQLVGVDGVVYNGNHGLERWFKGQVEIRPEAQGYVGKTAVAIKELGPILLPLGVVFEDKGAGLVFHYRTLPHREEVRETILKEISRSSAAQCFKVDEARAVIELRPPIEITKGSVLKELIESYHLKAAVYMGDDIADIDAFDTMHALSRSTAFQGLALEVVGEGTPPEAAERADLLLNGVSEVEAFLSWLDETIPPKSR
jgi:trehalose 6-phosphate phosphatase